MTNSNANIDAPKLLIPHSFNNLQTTNCVITQFADIDTTEFQKHCAHLMPNHGQQEFENYLLTLFLSVLFRHYEQKIFGVSYFDATATSSPAFKIINFNTHISSDQTFTAVFKHIDDTLKNQQKTCPPTEKQLNNVVFIRTNQPLSDEQKTTLPRYFLDNNLAVGLIIENCGDASKISWLSHAHSMAMLNEDLPFAKQIAQHMLSLSTQLAANLRNPIGDYALLTKAEMRQLSARLTGPTVSTPKTPIIQIIEDNARNNPEKIAVIYNEKTLTYKQLIEQVNAVATRLLLFGLHVGDKVAVGLDPGLSVLPCLLGIHKAGGVYVPIDLSFPAHRIAAILDEIKPFKIILDKSPNEYSNVQITSDETDIFLKACELTIQVDSTHQIVIPDITLENVSHIFFTSGTTGKPKGVISQQKHLVHYIYSAITRYGFNDNDCFICAARFTFSISLFELLVALTAGGSVKFIDRDKVLDMYYLSQAITHVSVFHFGPSLLKKLLPYIKKHHADLSPFKALRHVSSGGDMVPPEVLQNLRDIFIKAEVFVIYGSSEVSCMGCTYEIPQDNKPITISRVGVPHQNVTIKIVNQYGQLMPAGSTGQLYVSGPGVVQGYLNLPQLTNEKFITVEGQRFYAIGDIGRLDANGNIQLLGREDFQVQIRGMRIELLEIEQCLKAHPSVLDCVVVARPVTNTQPTQDETEASLIAYLVAHEKALLSGAELFQYLTAHLPDYMVPALLVGLDKLPVNHNAKLDRSQLPPPNTENTLRTAVFEKAETKTQKALLSIWKTLLGTTEIGIDDDFFYSGGSSLQGVDLMHSIDVQLRIALSLNILMANRTIRTLAHAIDNSSSNDDDNLTIAIKKTQNSENIFFIHDGNGEVIPYFSLSQQLNTPHSIYGISPKKIGRSPIANATFEEMVASYITAIKKIQSNGPYIIGGLCIGGYLAYCVAAQMQAEGNDVPAIILFDSHYIDATPQHTKKTQRKKSLLEAIDKIKHSSSRYREALRLASILPNKANRYFSYKVNNTVQTLSNKLKITLLKTVVTHPRLMRLSLPFPSVDTTLRYAEKKYRARLPYMGKIILFRATQKLATLDHLGIDDTPYCQRYQGEDLGWNKLQPKELVVHPINAGHSTLLTPPFSHDVAQHIAAELRRE